MDILNSIDDIRRKHRGSVVTIGNFDGVHRGHQKIIEAVLREARRLGRRSLAITFEPHPLKVLRPERGVKTLTTPAEKARLLGIYGIDAVLFVGFNREFASLRAEDFINEVLVGALNARMVVVGHNYVFGKGRKGTTALLKKQGEKLGFGVRVVRHATVGGSVVSSSRVRSLLGWGKVLEAARNLGRPYMIEGIVVEGAGRGSRLLDTPTANITTDNEMVPKHGVYAVFVEMEGRLLEGVSNIGTNPTFSGTRPSYEVHIFDWSGDLRGKTLRLHFVDRLRDEIAFPDADSLHDQIIVDIERAREILLKHGGLIPI